MPIIDEYKPKRKVSFKKKPYRPWSLYEEPSNEASKKESIRYQLDTNLVSKIIPINNQLDNINKSKGNHLDTNKVSIGDHISNQIFKPEIETTPQYQIKSDTLRRLYGLQRKIFFYVANQCVLRGQLSSGPITNETFRELTNTDVNTIKTAIARLVEKKLLEREHGKRGKGGFVSFRLSEALRNAAIEELRYLDIGYQLGTNWMSIKEPNPQRSSSTYLNTTTTLHKPLLPEEWDNIDIQPLESIRFTKSHLEQIYKTGQLTYEVVQESIYAFAFDLDNNDKGIQLKLSPLQFFIGILRKGSPYLPPENYESPQEKAMRLFILRKKELEKKHQSEEQEALELALAEWVPTLTDSQIREICPAPYMKDGNDYMRNAYLKTHFKEEVWPKLKMELTGNT